MSLCCLSVYSFYSVSIYFKNIPPGDVFLSPLLIKINLKQFFHYYYFFLAYGTINAVSSARTWPVFVSKTSVIKLVIKFTVRKPILIQKREEHFIEVLAQILSNTIKYKIKRVNKLYLLHQTWIKTPINTVLFILLQMWLKMNVPLTKPFERYSK